MNVDLLERQVETDQNRLEKGEINLTDLAQSESSLAGARAKLITAQNDLVTSKANFEKIIGKKPSENIQEIKDTIVRVEKEKKLQMFSNSHYSNLEKVIQINFL